MKIKIKQFKIKHYKEVYSLWKTIKGFKIRSIDDSKQNIKHFLKRNRNLSCIALYKNKIVGTLLCGHDGRTAGFYHTAVKDGYRNKGIGTKMVKYCIKQLKQENINQVEFVCFSDNIVGIKFWKNHINSEKNKVEYYTIQLNKQGYKAI